MENLLIFQSHPQTDSSRVIKVSNMDQALDFLIKMYAEMKAHKTAEKIVSFKLKQVIEHLEKFQEIRYFQKKTFYDGKLSRQAQETFMKEYKKDKVLQKMIQYCNGISISQKNFSEILEKN